MRIGVISDIHANLEALDAVLAHLDAQEHDATICLGDFVGYGPDPNGCIERVRPRLLAAVAGNHDRAAVGLRPVDAFNLYAQAAILWTSQSLNDASRTFLQGLPDRHELEGLLLVHGSPRDPTEEYVLTARTAKGSFAAATFAVALMGHTHQPVVYEELNHRVYTRGLLPEVPYVLQPDRRYLINGGSVGQPRDGDPRAAYAALDTEARTITLFRVPYPFEETQRKMEAAGLPAPLIERLAAGR